MLYYFSIKYTKISNIKKNLLIFYKLLQVKYLQT